MPIFRPLQRQTAIEKYVSLRKAFLEVVFLGVFFLVLTFVISLFQSGAARSHLRTFAILLIPLFAAGGLLRVLLLRITMRRDARQGR